MTEALEGQVSWSDLDFSFGKMSLEPLVQTLKMDSETSGLCWKKLSASQNQPFLHLDCRANRNGLKQEQSTVMGGLSLGELTMLNTGECPSVAVESRLSQILEDSPHPKYSLSAKACEGILRRAERRGKALPEMLKTALLQMIERERGLEEPDKATHYKMPPCLVLPTAGFCTEHSAQAGNIGYQEEISPVNASNPQSGDPCHTLSTDSRNILVEPIYCLQGNGIDRADTAGCNGKGWKEDTSYTLNTIDRPAVAYSQQAYDEYIESTVSCTLKHHGGTYGGGSETLIQEQSPLRYIVRRLTPLECERLQGFPDHWTDIGDWIDSKGKKHKGDADSPRYKALGNSIALPFWYWMFKNMAKHLPDDATLGSLFDGIGGFPICWEAIQGKGTARWASEIEEFPIAVTKIRFPDNNDL